MLTKDIKLKSIIRLQFLMVIACIFTGWLAGASVDRYIVRVPAWRKMDILTWAEYVQHAYLGNGFLLYQIETGCSFVMLVISCYIIAVHRLRFVALPVYSAMLLTIVAIVITFITAPVMHSLHELNNDAELLQQAFDRVHRVGLYRAMAQILAFIACAWAMGRCFVIRYVRVD